MKGVVSYRSPIPANGTASRPSSISMPAWVLRSTNAVLRRTIEKTVLPTLGERVLVQYARQTLQAWQPDARSEQAVRDCQPESAGSDERPATRVGRSGRRVAHGTRKQTPMPFAVSALGSCRQSMSPPLTGRYHLDPYLPSPPLPTYDLAEALMPETDDLSEPCPVLHECSRMRLHSLRRSTAIHRGGPTRTPSQGRRSDSRAASVLPTSSRPGWRRIPAGASPAGTRKPSGWSRWIRSSVSSTSAGSRPDPFRDDE